MISKFTFLFSESLRELFRAKLPAAISSITIGIALVIFSLAYFTYENLLGYSHQFKSRYRIEVFFYSDLDQDKGRDLFNTILIMDVFNGVDLFDTTIRHYGGEDTELALRIFKSFPQGLRYNKS